MSDMQALFDGLSAQWQRERAESQMTLGDMIKTLGAMPKGALVANLMEPHSYRGYYSDLAFELADDGERPASDLLSDCVAAMGRSFQGYKGGDYVMGEKTPVWVSEYGCCGDRLMNIRWDGKIETSPDDTL